MAEVFLARVEGPMGFEKTLVLKRILPHLAEDPAFVGMFFTEARVAAQLNHPHIVQIFDFGQADGTYYLAMEFIDGPDLRTLSARAVQGGVALPPAFCAKVISAACEGLAFAHDFVDPASGKHLELIHRDISPDNILLSRQGAVKVVDFGIAKATNQSHKTKTGLIKGKIAYMPVEQLQGQQLDRRADVYALGLVLYELLTGQYPFEATTDVSMMQAILFEPLVPASSRRPDLPQALVDILDRALAKVREQRYPDCVSFQADLERFILSTGQTVGARDMAQWVERLCPRNSGPAKPNPSDREDIDSSATLMSPKQTPSSVKHRATMAVPLDATHESGKKTNTTRVRTAPSHPTAQDSEPLLEPTLMSPSQRGLPAVQPEKTAVPKKEAGSEQEETAHGNRRRRAGLAAMVGGLVLVAAGSGFVLSRATSAPPEPAQSASPAPAQAMSTPPAEPQPVVAPPPQPEPVVAAPAAPAPEAQPEQPAEASQPVAAQTPEAAGEKPSTEPTPPEPTEAQPVRRKAAKAKLAFRIRPYATVFLDGTALGQTPLSPVQVSIGTHTVRLINRELGKDITRTIEVKAGQSNIITHDLSK
ncbi:protein kinase [Archangium gephyra]|nr:protein kinase [Archangium gephyra]